MRKRFVTMLAVVFLYGISYAADPYEELGSAEAARHYARLNAAAALTRRDTRSSGKPARRPKRRTRV